MRAAIGNGNLEKLVIFDQLKKQMEARLAFAEFVEGFFFFFFFSCLLSFH